MKSLLLVALVVSSVSFGRSIRQVALESVETPAAIYVQNSDAKIIRVALDGEVFGGTCGMRVKFGRPGPDGTRPGHPVEINYGDCEWKTVKFISGTEMQEIVRLTDLARHAVIQHPDPFAMRCMAMPTHSVHMTADNGSVFLKSGTYPCGGQSYNTSEAAQTLVEKLNQLRGEYNRVN